MSEVSNTFKNDMEIDIFCKEWNEVVSKLRAKMGIDKPKKPILRKSKTSSGVTIWGYDYEMAKN